MLVLFFDLERREVISLRMRLSKRVKELTAPVGGFSWTSKMPGPSWGIPARHCQVGMTLRGVRGSTCESCYALKGFYFYLSVKEAQQRRLDIYNSNPWLWVSKMSRAIKGLGVDYFRWFDSGDLQSYRMLVHLVSVAQLCPGVKFWLPTRETFWVTKFLRLAEELPENLTVRVSMPMIGQGRARGLPDELLSSGVEAAGEESCPSAKQNHQCLDCRKCWDREVLHVSYGRH